MSDDRIPFIKCDGLVKIYKLAGLETVALQGLDLEVMKGEVLGIVGNSGSGKTTLLNILGGLDRPSAGRVQVGGIDLLKLSDRALASYRRQSVGFVWQQSGRNLIPYLSAEENVALPMVICGLKARERRERTRELLSTLGMAHRRQHSPARLSGGEQQRIAIAVSLANQPALVLADEPTGEVDTETAVTIYEGLRAVSRDWGATVIIVSHDRNLASRVDRAVAIRDGKVSTETTRRRESADGNGHPRSREATEMDELVVLDSAGRLQLPRDLLERFGITNRVRVEHDGDHITIRPAERKEQV